MPVLSYVFVLYSPIHTACEVVYSTMIFHTHIYSLCVVPWWIVLTSAFQNASKFAANASQSDADWLGFAKADNFAAYVYVSLTDYCML